VNAESRTAEGALLWQPGAKRIDEANLTEFMHWLAGRGRSFADYHALWRWSVEDLDGFWQAVWDFYKVRSSTPTGPALAKSAMPGAKWFPSARLNYAEHILRQEKPGATAMLFLSETAPLAPVTWDRLAGQVRILAERLRSLGIKPGDRVVAVMPNIPETVIAMLATTAIGAIWACCSPDFGAQGALDRLQQLKPKALFCVDFYCYGGKPFDRGADLRQIIAGLADVEHIVYLPHLDPERASPADPRVRRWSDMLAGPKVAASEFRFEQVPFDHPLWILFSSGTTGLPKAIMHSHGGILLEMLKSVGLMMDLKPGDRMFFYTTTGWMIWNFLVSAMLCEVVPVLYDGNPAYPDIDVLWKMAQDCGAAFFGASPTLVDMMAKAGINPGEKYDLSSLRAIMAAGSPVSPEQTAWFYRAVKSDLWVAVGSGGTDCCTGFVGGVVTLPVYAGEMQAPALGVAAESYDEAGNSQIDQVGELVITKPLPSMPVGFWNDPGGERYRETYFADYPGVWRHGDFFRINRRGGCFVLGRSDATLNRQGIRIGTAEIYRALATLPAIEDAVIVNLDLPGGRFFMPLFVKLKPGFELDAALENDIKQCLRKQYTPRHVPDRVIAVPDIPKTLTGKKMEVPVRKILMRVPLERAVNPSAMANPQSIDFFADYASRQEDYRLS
jgi:acetoacetyl-CoA synthetase